MDTGQAIENIARAEARRVRPITDPDELRELEARHGRPLSAIEVRRRPACDGGVRFEAIARDRDPGHENAPRLPFLTNFINVRVLPLIDPAADVTGVWRVELHDSYSYLPDRERYEEVLTFGRAPDARERRVALIPDPFHMGDFGGLLASASADAVPWAAKEPLLFFAGTTTGDRDPARNDRIRACVWSLDHRDVAHMHITKVAQMQPDAIVRAHPRVAETLRAPFSVEAHFKYRYQVNLAGNTACWSRLPMIMSTRSVMVHARDPCGDAMWYYPLLREGQHYVGADSAAGEDLLRAHAFCRAHDRQCKAMVDEANALARELFHPGAAASYLATLLEASVA
jgi:hypothetical protein